MTRRNGRASAIQVIPSARRLIGSLRDLGYEFPQAVADLVDNSITAGAGRVEIDLEFAGPDSWLRITDDGHGMGGREITEAMRYGTEQTYDEEDLGRFGLGLKTASLSQCRVLTVASRRSPRTGRLEVRRLDLDHISDCNRWEILSIPASHRDQRLTSALRRRQGTVVLWESLDRVLGYKLPWGRRAETAVAMLVEELKLHLGMVFHRFIEGRGLEPLRIRVNGSTVSPWDPFALSEDATQILPAEDVDLQTQDTVGLVRFQPYVLPPRSRFSSDESFQLHGGPRRWNAQQGFYIYRSNRLIQSGGWCRMRAQDEHLKLARAAIDFFPELDSAFEVNVAKVRVSLPAELKEQLSRPLEQLLRAAQAAYRAHPERSSNGQPSRGGARKSLEAAAKATGEVRGLRRIAKQLKASDPTAAKRLGW